MPAEICRRCNAVEECYEFMLAYAAQGVSSGDGIRITVTKIHRLKRIGKAVDELLDTISA
jgi:uncharacterized protein YoaH (UPF0181 family)